MPEFQSLEVLESALDVIKLSPSDIGSVRQIVIRPKTNERKVVEDCQLSLNDGLVGDNWKVRGFGKGAAHPEMQLNLMNSRVIEAIAGGKLSQAMAGDQFFVDFDLSKQNLPAGTRLQIGEAQIEVTAEPHLGCKKFSQRFGKDAVKFVNSKEGKLLNLRGINAKVIVAGTVATGAIIRKLS